MTPTTWIALLWVGFAATHVGLADVRVEPRLRRSLGDLGFLGLYSAVAFALFVPLVWIYFANRHAGAWLWHVPVGPELRVVLYAAMTLATILVVAALIRPSPAAVVPGEAKPSGVYRITRHPLNMGLAILMGLHLIPNGSSADVAFFGGFVAFAVLGSWHQDLRKLHAGDPGFRAFYEATSFWPFAGRDSLRGLRELPPAVVLGGVAAALAMRWLHGSIWPH
jgi:uncharacterized membrane protein